MGPVTRALAALKPALAGLTPPKDSSGKVQYVPRAVTVSAWAPVPPAFDTLESEVTLLIRGLPQTPIAACETQYAQAEAVIVDNYGDLRKRVLTLMANVEQKVQYFPAGLENTAPVDVKVTAFYNGQDTSSKTFHLDPNFAILTSSAGFMVTALSSRSYTSATSPDPADATKTQNVLRVDGSGVNVAIPVLLNGNLPGLNSRNYGIGVSAGPVFSIVSGKADTSHFSFFGGISIRVTPHIYLTPGLNVGEFADFPQGFKYPGQVIPANTGTPTPVKRYTARFAFAITYRLKDLYSPAASGGQAAGASAAGGAAAGK
jgi:hypothetical protein